MTQDELMLFKELLKETIRSTVKETIQEELSAVIKKDLKEVKMLLAKSIKESVAIRENGNQPQYSPVDKDEMRQRIREAVGGGDYRDSMMTNKRSPLPMMSSDQAANISMNGTLPDFDAPIPMIKKDGIAWKELQERIK
jgi:hypothetical protein